MDVDDRRGTRAPRELFDASNTALIACSHVLLRGVHDRRRVSQDVDALRGGDYEWCQDCGRENEQGIIDAPALVIDDDT